MTTAAALRSGPGLNNSSGGNIGDIWSFLRCILLLSTALLFFCLVAVDDREVKSRVCIESTFYIHTYFQKQATNSD